MPSGGSGRSARKGGKALGWASVASGAAGWLMVLPDPFWWMGFGCVALSVVTGTVGLRREDGPHGLCLAGLLLSAASSLASFLLLRGA